MRPITPLEFESEYLPFEYLEFARQDLETMEDTRNTINALGNVKRALHLQAETICNGYGYKAKSRDFYLERRAPRCPHRAGGLARTTAI